jgi:NitT/TauT family transport system ATP-binding protein
MYDENIKFLNDVNVPDVIELKDIRQSYDNGKTYIIKDLNLLIEDNTETGKFVVVLGTSGCGKSTILRYITGIQKPTSGQVLINGKPRDEKVVIGMVFQQYSSFPWLSVLDNVALGLKYKGMPHKERHDRAMEMVRLVGLEGQEKKFAKYPTLSGGQLQRVAIARSLVSTPEILLMDEPFGALDINTRLKMQELLCQIWSKLKTTVIFVTHDIPEAVYLGNEIFIMRSNPGRIAERIVVDLPYERNYTMKREKCFTDQVYNVEDKLKAIQAHVEDESKQKQS